MRAILGGAPDYKKVSFVMVWAPPHVTRASEGRLSESADMAAFSCARVWEADPSLRDTLTVYDAGSASRSEARARRGRRGAR